jgi:hypothetical protein
MHATTPHPTDPRPVDPRFAHLPPPPNPGPYRLPAPVTPPYEHRLAYSVACWAAGLGALALGSTLHLAVDALNGTEVDTTLAAFWLTFLVVAAPFALWAASAVLRIEDDDPDAVRSGTRDSLSRALLWGAGIVGIGRLLLGVFRFIDGVLARSADGADLLADIAHVGVTVAVAGAVFWTTWQWRNRRPGAGR